MQRCPIGPRRTPHYRNSYARDTRSESSLSPPVLGRTKFLSRNGKVKRCAYRVFGGREKGRRFVRIFSPSTPPSLFVRTESSNVNAATNSATNSATARRRRASFLDVVRGVFVAVDFVDPLVYHMQTARNLVGVPRD